MKFILPVLALFACFFAAAMAGATPENREITFSFNDAGWPPYLVMENGDRAGGIMLDVLRTIASMHGLGVTIRPYPEKRGLLYLKKGKIDAFPKAMEWVKHPEEYTWTDPVVDSADVIVFRRSHPIVFNRPEDLFGKRIGTVRGYGYPLLDRYFSDGRIYRDDARSEKPMLKKLLLGRIDAAVINKLVALWMISPHSEFRDMFAFSENNVGKAGYRFMFTVKYDWKPFAADFNEELSKMKKDGRLRNILEEYK